MGIACIVPKKWFDTRAPSDHIKRSVALVQCEVALVQCEVALVQCEVGNKPHMRFKESGLLEC
jgi:hypothetical protein